MIIKIIFISKDIGIIENNIFFELFLFSAIKLLIARGKDNWAIVISKQYVGNIILYRFIASVVTVLVNIIFIIKPNIFVNKAPIININVDFINLFFIIKYMIYSKRKYFLLIFNIKIESDDWNLNFFLILFYYRK